MTQAELIITLVNNDLSHDRCPPFGSYLPRGRTALRETSTLRTETLNQVVGFGS